MKAFTCKEMELTTGQKRTVLHGNPKKPEPAQHIIMFPGGSIEVSRTENDEYMVHIAVNHKEIVDGTTTLAKRGDVVSSRLDYDYPHNVIGTIPNIANLNHLAIRVRTQSAPEGSINLED